MTAKVTMYCDGIMCESTFDFEMPGWTGEKDVEDDGHYLFCPECEQQESWFSAACPGCVGNYPDCELSESFAYTHKRTIMQNQLNIIKSGVCLFRTNGTSMITRSGIQSFDLSERAPEGSGDTIAKGIAKYCEEYND